MTPQLKSSEFTAVQPEGFIQLAGRWFANLPTATRDETGSALVYSLGILRGLRCAQ